MLIGCLKHHHRLRLCRHCIYHLRRSLWRLRWINCIHLIYHISGVAVRSRLPTSLLLIVEHWHFALIFLSQLLEELQARWKMLYKSVLHFIWLGLLANLKQCFLEISYWTWRLMHSIRVWSACYGLRPLVWIERRKSNSRARVNPLLSLRRLMTSLVLALCSLAQLEGLLTA